MDILDNWQEIRNHFNKSFRSNFYVSFATVDKDNNPVVTPIGSLFLNNDQSGFYFEKFPSKIHQNYLHNKNICILGVKSNSWFWLTSLFRGKFNENPALKLYGQLGEKRKATEHEIQRLNRRMKATKMLKGNNYLWGKMEYVRDIYFTKVEKINLGIMTQEL